MLDNRFWDYIGDIQLSDMVDTQDNTEWDVVLIVLKRQLTEIVEG